MRRKKGGSFPPAGRDAEPFGLFHVEQPDGMDSEWMGAPSPWLLDRGGGWELGRDSGSAERHHRASVRRQLPDAARAGHGAWGSTFHVEQG